MALKAVELFADLNVDPVRAGSVAGNMWWLDPVIPEGPPIPLVVRVRVVKAHRSLVGLYVGELMKELERRGVEGCIGARVSDRTGPEGDTTTNSTNVVFARGATYTCYRFPNPGMLPKLWARHRAASAVQRWWRRGRFRREKARFVRADDLMFESGDPGPLPLHLVQRVLSEALAARLRERWGH
mmetsp:Transcript_32815/g.82814  ORF Transcript_32815/g.82814 Transcript_32815/m.82814 type:complete len:184 (-) Transcript_32815:275-826(-)